MAGDCIVELAGKLLKIGDAFKDGFGALWNVSVTGERKMELQKGGAVVPAKKGSAHQNWVRYLHTPDIWQSNFDELKEVPTWEDYGKIANVDKLIGQRKAFDGLVNAWCDIVRGAEYLVDITSLEVPEPDSAVGRALLDAIEERAKNWQPDKHGSQQLVIRLFGGTPQSNTSGFRTNLERRLKKHIKEESDILVLFGCDYRGVAFRKPKYVGKNKTWNHSKIVAADGWRAITGGHNMNAEGSYTKAPVIHDLSVEVRGHGAFIAHEFCSSLWHKGHATEFIDAYWFNPATNAFVHLEGDNIELLGLKMALAEEQVESVSKLINSAPPQQDPDDFVPADAVMGIGRWGDVAAKGVTGNGIQRGVGIDSRFGYQYCSDRARQMMLADAKKTICISQQDLVNKAWTGMVGYTDTYHDGCYRLAEKLKAGPINIRVVLSAKYAQDSGKAPYAYGNSTTAATRLIVSFAKVGRHLNLPENAVCTIAPIAFCEARGVERRRYTWPDAWRNLKGFFQGHAMQRHRNLITYGFGPGNHAKALMVDDELVLIGSDNMYPSPLAEFSFVIEGEEAIREYKKVYWDPMWGYSKRFGRMIVGREHIKKYDQEKDVVGRDKDDEPELDDSVE